MGLNLFHKVGQGATIKGNGVDIELLVLEIGKNGNRKTARLDINYHPGSKTVFLDGSNDVVISPDIRIGVSRGRGFFEHQFGDDGVSLYYSCPRQYDIRRFSRI